MDPRELQSLEELCVQDDAPWCQAACPLHVDARGMLAALARGDLHAAAGLYAKRVSFPGVLSRICDQPCRAVCRRAEAGDALQVGLLERACAELAGFVAEQRRQGSPKEQRVAVVGAGLSGLAAAFELARKHYSVTIFEAEDRPGGRLRMLSPEVLPPDVVDAELSFLCAWGVEVRTGTRVGADVSLAEVAEQWQAVYVAVGGAGGGQFAALGDVDPVTLATTVPGVFARSGTRRGSPVLAMSEGYRAAISIDRFLKGESLALHREKEGPYETRLFTSLVGVEPAIGVVPETAGGGYTREEAAAEAKRCLQCACLECVKACTYLEHFHEYPGTCIRKVTKNISSLPGKSYRTHTPFLNACSLCGLCGEVCPTDLDMAVVNSEARRIMWDKAFMPPAIHQFALSDMEASNAARHSLVRNQPGTTSSAYLFFPGCQLVASAPGQVEQTYRFLAETLEGGIGFMSRCCGAPAAWSGRQDAFRQVLDEFLELWGGMGRPRVIFACPTCSLMFNEHLPEVPAVSLWEVLDRCGLPAEAPRGEGRRLALHDSCTARSAREMQDGVRSVLARLGYEVEELAFSRERTKCCGYGGLMYLVNPELTGKVIESRASESASDYVTYCSNCRDFFAGKGKVAYHMLDLIFGNTGPEAGGPPRRGPTWSERRTNRHRLIERMLTDVWKEPMPEPREHEWVRVRLAPDAAIRMESDFILEDDVKRVIYEAEKSGNKLRLPGSGRFVAHFRPSIITYWVEYAPAGDEYEVFNAYSHRMQIVKDVCRDES